MAQPLNPTLMLIKVGLSKRYSQKTIHRTGTAARKVWLMFTQAGMPV